VIVITLVGRFLLRPLFQIVASTHSTELFVAALLFVIVGAGVVAYQAGLSMALGAFVAGLMLAETEYGKAIESTTEPFKGLLLGIFFFTVGMNIDFREFVREPVWLFGAVFGLIGAKSLILLLLGKAFRLSWSSALETALLLGPGGEFAFVTIGLAAGAALINQRIASFTLAATSVTMALTPFLALAARRVRIALAAKRGLDPALVARPPAEEKHAIVVGYGRVGKVVCAMLKQHNIHYIAVDSDAAEVADDRRNGHNVYYGNATNAEFLKTCGLMQATGIIISIHSRAAIDNVVAQVREIRPDILIVSRARDADHAKHLYEIGASDAVPETIEASLQLSEASLVGLGVPMGPVIASVHEKRDEFRHALQKAARAAGQEGKHSIKPKGDWSLG
jgi:K+:H+ antiporter